MCPMLGWIENAVVTSAKVKKECVFSSVFVFTYVPS